MVDKKVQFVVVSWLDAEQVLGVSKKGFARRIRSAEWVKRRCKIFKNFTLQSLLNQRYDNFRIWLYCGQTHKAITSQYAFGDRVEVCYDYGRKFIAEMEAPWFSLTRIDSDDCFHKDAMLEVRDNTITAPHKTTMSFKDLIQWNILHNFISDIRIIVSPFTTHCWPKAIYRNFDTINKQQFAAYRNPPLRLSHRKVCIIRHKDNVTWTRIGKDPGSHQYMMEERAKRNNFITNRGKIIQTLKDFGIEANQIPNRSC